MVQYKGIVANNKTLEKITRKAEDVKSYPLKDGKSEITFPFLVKVILTTSGWQEKAAYILANGVLAIVTEEKQEITDINFMAGEKALEIVFNNI
jgi:hypothetical protein